MNLMKNILIALINNNITKYLIPIFLWGWFIYYLSDQPSLKSSFDPIWDLVLRKMAHMAEFGVLAFLIFRLFNFYGLGKKKIWFFVIVFSFSYAVYDEVHQSFVQGRYGSVRDMLIDFNGAILGMISWNLFKLRSKKKRK